MATQEKIQDEPSKMQQLWSGGADMSLAELFQALRDESIFAAAVGSKWLEVSVCFAEEAVGCCPRQMEPMQIVREWGDMLTPGQIVRLSNVKTRGVAIVHDWGISLYEPAPSDCES